MITEENGEQILLDDKKFIDKTIASFKFLLAVLVSVVALSKIKFSTVVCLEMEFHVLVTRFKFYVLDMGTGYELFLH